MMLTLIGHVFLGMMSCKQISMTAVPVNLNVVFTSYFRVPPVPVVSRQIQTVGSPCLHSVNVLVRKYKMTWRMYLVKNSV